MTVPTHRDSSADRVPTHDAYADRVPTHDAVANPDDLTTDQGDSADV